MTADPTPSPADRVTIPLMQAGTEVSLVLTFWATYPEPPACYGWCAGQAVGLLLTLPFWHSYRILGAIPVGLTAAFGGALAAVIWGWCVVTGVVVGTGAGLCIGAIYNGRLRGRGPDIPLAWPVTSLAFCAVVGIAPLVWFTDTLAASEPYTLAAAILLAGPVLFAWLRLFRPFFELACEPVLWVMYKARAAGPGLAEFPLRGPCLVVANHACWLDPLFLAKVLPRPATPMMTSKFYDVPVLRRLMRAFGVIRVPEATYKQDPAEIREAVAALDRGECVLIFPEGFMRRSEEKPLRRFGRGVWQILQARPFTPVFACWIEGGWGSYCSYYNGKPTKNKKPDLRRPIGVGVSAAVVVDPATLESHLPTRLFLMNRVAEARKHLGLPELPAFELPPRSEEAEEEDSPQRHRDHRADPSRD
jgi:1-acyl-sn-glycerol-3-phosphate acyltransferase